MSDTYRRAFLRYAGLSVGTTAGLCVGSLREPTVVEGNQMSSQLPEKTWSQVYGNSNHAYNYIYSLTEIDNGDYVFVGDAGVNKEALSQMWAMRVDPSGKPLWTKTYGNDEYHEAAMDILETENNNLMIVGYKRRRGERTRDGLTIKIDMSGNILWKRDLTTKKSSSLKSVTRIAEDSYLASGGIYENNTKGDGLVLCITSEGSTRWSWTSGGENFDYLYSITSTNHDTVVSSGYANLATDSRGGDGWVIELDREGNLTWKYTYGHERYTVANSIIATSDGGFLVGGVDSRNNDKSDTNIWKRSGWLLKLNPDGTKEWSKTYDGGEYQDTVQTVIETTDGGYAFLGERNEAEDGESVTKYWLVKVGPRGDKQWERTYYRSPSDSPESLIQTSDGDYVLAGFTSEYDTTDEYITRRDGWVIKVDVNDPPEAAFSVTGERTAGNSLRFDASDSADPDGSLGAYRWDFTGDGSVDARGKTVEHTFADPGRYRVTLTVTDTDGKSDTVERSIDVAAPPTATSTASPTRSPTSSASPEPTGPPETASPTDGGETSSSADGSLAGAGLGVSTAAGLLAWWRRRNGD